MELFKLFGSVLIDDKDAIDSLNKVDKKGKSTGQKFVDVAKKGALVGAAVVGAGVAAGGALLGMATKASNTADTIHKASQRIGISTGAYQELDFWASQNGLSSDNMEKAVGRLNQRIGMAADGNKKYSDALSALGINMDDVREGTLSTEDAMTQSIQALSEIENGQQQAALASELFGTKLGREMLPALQDGALSIEDAAKKAEELGIVMDGDAISAGVKFSDTMDQVKTSLSAVGDRVGTAVMPMVQKFLDFILNNMPAIQKTSSAVFNAIKVSVDVLVEVFRTYLLPVIKQLFYWIQENMPMIRTIFAQVFESVKEIWESTLLPVFEAIMNVLGLVWELFKTAWPHIWTLVKIVFDNIKNIWETILQPTIMFIIDIINVLVAEFKKHMPAIQKTFKTLVDAIKSYYETIFKPAIEAIATIIAWLRDKFTEYILPLVTRVIGWFASMASGMTEKINNARDKIKVAIDKIKGFFDGIKTAKDNVLRIFSDVYSGIKNKIESARDTVKTAIDKIKGFFNFKWKLPKLKMPTFSVSGSKNPLKWLTDGVPKLKVNWNAKGGIFDKPTIFNTARGLQGVGEAGSEAILPLNAKTYGGIGKGIGDSLGMSDLGSKLDRIAELLINTDYTIVMDDRVVGKIVEPHVTEKQNSDREVVKRFAK